MRDVVLFRAGTSELAKPRILDDRILENVNSLKKPAGGRGAQSLGNAEHAIRVRLLKTQTIMFLFLVRRHPFLLILTVTQGQSILTCHIPHMVVRQHRQESGGSLLEKLLGSIQLMIKAENLFS